MRFDPLVATPASDRPLQKSGKMGQVMAKDAELALSKSRPLLGNPAVQGATRIELESLVCGIGLTTPRGAGLRRRDAP